MSELIDRESTVKQICKMGEMVGGHDRDVVISIALFVQDDKTAFPTVERPHGEWIDEGVYADYVGQHVYKCTYCNDRIIEFPTELGSYCKYCGSDNRKREGDQE